MSRSPACPFPSQPFHKLPDQPVHLVRCIGVGIVPGPGDPHQRDAGVFVPGPVVPDAGTGMIFFSADQQRRAGNPVREIGFHGLCQDFEPMA